MGINLFDDSLRYFIKGMLPVKLDQQIVHRRGSHGDTDAFGMEVIVKVRKEGRRCPGSAALDGDDIDGSGTGTALRGQVNIIALTIPLYDPIDGRLRHPQHFSNHMLRIAFPVCFYYGFISCFDIRNIL